tara:strand:- start:259 stop:927 length:669 start_codon:yes stop_codon:yes gene_type:complete
MIRISIILASLLLVVTLTTFNPSSFNSGLNLFKIKNIEIVNTKILEKKNLNNLFNIKLDSSNLLSVNKKIIQQILKDNQLIKSIEIRKIYPNKLKIKIYEKEPIAILYNKTEKFYLTKIGEEIIFFKNKTLKNLPKIYGSQKNFLQVYSSLIDSEFPISEIKSFYYFDIGRWDIILKNSKIIKLPVKDFDESLTNYKNLNKDLNFDKYTIFDYRIKDQLILN